MNLPLPRSIFQPGESAALGPNPDPAAVAADMIGPTDVGIVNVADGQMAINIDQQFPVAEDDFTRHER